MKESIGGTQIFIIVFTLIILFAGIMAFTINYSNAFAVKDQLVSLVETAGGFDLTTEIVEGSINNDETLEKIVETLDHNSYRQKGKCPESKPSEGYTVAGYQRNGAKTLGNNEDSFCIVKIDAKSPEGTPPRYYYQIIVFYRLDLPIIKALLGFKAIGETKILYK